ncbi:MAG TPA: Nif3-like dinuclear metal center hexameric protein [Thermodesulfobacteriota bacterium]|nr:Nif3-like dinuclear metal center hexameric protein [Thermodesulfobacteriota bacterium]
MPKLNKIVAFLDEFLGTDDVDDSSWNVLQFEGKSIVKRAAFAVDAGIDAFKMSADVKADILIVHHGHFWDFRNPSITGWAKERIKILFENDISIYVSHNPLDRHKEVGHNAQILKLLGARITDEFFSLSREKHRLDGRVPECVSVEKKLWKSSTGS